MRFLVIGKGVVGSSLYYLLKEKGHEVRVVESGYRKFYPSLIHSLLLKGKDIDLALSSRRFYISHSIPFQPFISYTIGEVSSNTIDDWISRGFSIEERYADWLKDRAIIARDTDGLVYVKKLIDSVPYSNGVAKVIVRGKKFKIMIGDNDYSDKFDGVIMVSGAWNRYNVQGIELPLRSYYCWAWLVRTGDATLDKAIVYDYKLGFYSRPFLGLGWKFAIIGDGETVESSPFIKQRGDRKAVDSARKRFGDLIPIYKGDGYCEATPDMRPLYGEIIEGLYIVGGLNGYGAEVGPGLASLLVEYIENGEVEKEYYIDRFRNGEEFIHEFSIGKEPHEL